MASFIKANNTFAITLLKMLCQEEGKDVLFSPPSISFTLAMVLLGAKNDTAAQIEQLFSSDRGEDVNLCFQSLLTQMNEPDPSYLLETTNRLFGENVLNFLPSFKESCEKFYNSVLEHVCFSEEAETMRKHINAWVEDNTEGKILEAVPMDSVNPLNLLIFVNAIKFKLTWKTDPEPMKRTPRSQKIIQEYRFSQIISKEKLFLGFYIEELNATVYISSYDQTELIIIFVFPRDDGKKMEKELTYETFIAWTKPDVRALKKILGKQFLPKIKIEKSYDMFNILCSLGMCDAFHKDKADFSGLSELKAFYLLSVFHSSSLEFNEEGIQASAATVALEIPGNAQGKRRCKYRQEFIFVAQQRKIFPVLKKNISMQNTFSFHLWDLRPVNYTRNDEAAL